MSVASIDSNVTASTSTTTVDETEREPELTQPDADIAHGKKLSDFAERAVLNVVDRSLSSSSVPVTFPCKLVLARKLRSAVRSGGKEYKDYTQGVSIAPAVNIWPIGVNSGFGYNGEWHKVDVNEATKAMKWGDARKMTDREVGETFDVLSSRFPELPVNTFVWFDLRIRS